MAASPQPDVVADTQFTIHSSYSPSESYLTFVPPPNYPSAVACFTKLLVKLYFTSDKEINFNLHYLVFRTHIPHSLRSEPTVTTLFFG